MAKQQQLNMSPEELQIVMGVNERWPYPAHEDGWVMAHNAIRLDMTDLDAAFHILVSQLDTGRVLQPWQVSHLQKYWPVFYKQFSHHHDNEEDIFFPWMETRVKLPPKMSADHKTLHATADKCTKLVQQLNASTHLNAQVAQMKELQSTFNKFRTMMCEHLAEEEEQGLPMLRKHFTAKEAHVVEQKIVKNLTPSDLAWFLRPLPSMAAKRALMTNKAKIPGLVQKLIMVPAINKYDRKVVILLNDLKRGDCSTKVKGGCFGGCS